MSKEALQIQLDNLRLEVQQLRVANARLRDERPEVAKEIDAQDEVDRMTAELVELRQLLHESQESEARAVDEAKTTKSEFEGLKQQWQNQDQVIARQRGDIERLTGCCKEHEGRYERVTRELDHVHTQAELERYRAVEAERRKWEEREARMVQQVREAKQRPTDECHEGGERSAAVTMEPHVTLPEGDSRPVGAGTVVPEELPPVHSGGEPGGDLFLMHLPSPLPYLPSSCH